MQESEYPSTVRAVVQTAPRQFEMREFPCPRIGPDDALLRVEACGICGSDIEQYEGNIPLAVFPLIPGHEPLGIIHAIGENAAQRWGVNVGDRVAVEPTLTCGSCEQCQDGARPFCEKSRIYGFFPIEQAPSVWGAYADYMYLHKDTVVHKMSRDVPAHLAALFNPLAAGIKWAVHEPKLRLGDTIVILGAGQRGLASVIAARAAGAGRIIVTDVSRAEEKLAIARELGADAVIVADREDVVARVRDLTDGRLADIVLDACGARQPLAESVYMVRKGGTVVIAGLKGRDCHTAFDTDFLVARSITLKGVYSADSAAYRQAIRMIEAGTVPFEKFGTRSFSIEHAAQAIHRLAGSDGEPPSVHVVIQPA